MKTELYDYIENLINCGIDTPSKLWKSDPETIVGLLKFYKDYIEDDFSEVKEDMLGAYYMSSPDLERYEDRRGI